MDRRTKGIMFDEIGKERYMPTDLVMVPIMVNLMLIFTFIFIGSVLFSMWEGWTATEAAYFCFVTLTTIGLVAIFKGFIWNLSFFFSLDDRFGDYTPVKSFEGFQHSFAASMKMCFTVSYCIFGD